MAIVQAFAAENREYRKFNAINKDHRNANINAIFAYSIFFPVVEIVLAVSTGILVWWIADKKLDAGFWFRLFLYINQIFRPLRVIADKFNVIQMGVIASQRVFTVLDNDDYIHQQGTFTPTEIGGKVQFNHVWFAYVGDHYVLKNIDFAIQPGETVALSWTYRKRQNFYY